MGARDLHNMVAEKGHPHFRLKAAQQSVKAARKMQKMCGCLNLVHAVSHYQVGMESRFVFH